MKTFIKCLTLLLFLSSCEKDNERTPVLAGVYDDTFIFYEFSPNLPLDLKPDTLNKFYYGSDSLDVNLDGKYDLLMSRRILLGTVPPARITNDNYPFGRVTLNNGLEVSTKKEIYPIGLGQTNEVNWVDTLLYNSRIDNLPEWSGSDTYRFMWVVPPASFWGSNGCWYNLINAERYIGIRMKTNGRYNYGWIKLKQVSREEVYIVSYAMEK
ncbi:MAG TPA: hypothetical protein VFG54_13795 [Prolixibacteraceae bacterium]|nr:hypothetical protein [Prolixibacteraceae bacterium]